MEGLAKETVISSVRKAAKPYCHECRYYDFEAVQGELGLCKRATYKELLVHPYDECQRGEWREEGMSRLREGDIVLDTRSGYERYFLCEGRTRLNEIPVYSGVTVTKMPYFGGSGSWNVQRCTYDREPVDTEPETYPVVGHLDTTRLIIDGVLKAVKG